jgi:hypothetical protein
MTPRRATIGSGAGPRRKSDFTNFCVHAILVAGAGLPPGASGGLLASRWKDFEWIVERDG